MNEFFKRVIEGSKVQPPEICRKSFIKNFENTANVEWFNKEQHHEAIFFKNDTEHIAVFDSFGKLVEYRQNLHANVLPMAIKNIIIQKGEIMNAILRNKGNKLEYEIIMRDDKQERYILIFSDTGDMIDENKL